MIDIETNAEPVNEIELRLLEKEIAAVLPPEYKNFLLEHNGGKPTIRRYITVDRKVESSLMYLYPLSDKTTPNLMEKFDYYNHMIPKNLLSIGKTPKKSQVCISISGDDYGSVYHWDLEDQEYIEGPIINPTYKYMKLIAKNFDEFINSLFSPA